MSQSMAVRQGQEQFPQNTGLETNDQSTQDNNLNDPLLEQLE